MIPSDLVTSTSILLNSHSPHPLQTSRLFDLATQILKVALQGGTPTSVLDLGEQRGLKNFQGEDYFGPGRAWDLPEGWCTGADEEWDHFDEIAHYEPETGKIVIFWKKILCSSLRKSYLKAENSKKTVFSWRAFQVRFASLLLAVCFHEQFHHACHVSRKYFPNKNYKHFIEGGILSPYGLIEEALADAWSYHMTRNTWVPELEDDWEKILFSSQSDGYKDWKYYKNEDDFSSGLIAYLLENATADKEHPVRSTNAEGDWRLLQLENILQVLANFPPPALWTWESYKEGDAICMTFPPLTPTSTKYTSSCGWLVQTLPPSNPLDMPDLDKYLIQGHIWAWDNDLLPIILLTHTCPQELCEGARLVFLSLLTGSSLKKENKEFLKNQLTMCISQHIFEPDEVVEWLRYCIQFRLHSGSAEQALFERKAYVAVLLAFIDASFPGGVPWNPHQDAINQLNRWSDRKKGEQEGGVPLNNEGVLVGHMEAFSQHHAAGRTTSPPGDSRSEEELHLLLRHLLWVAQHRTCSSPQQPLSWRNFYPPKENKEAWRGEVTEVLIKYLGFTLSDNEEKGAAPPNSAGVEPPPSAQLGEGDTRVAVPPSKRHTKRKNS